MSCWVYLVRCRNGALYCGQTADLEARLRLHASGKGARSVRMAGFDRLAASWPVADRSAALRLEAAIKRLDKATKEALVRQPERLVTLAPPTGPGLQQSNEIFHLNGVGDVADSGCASL
ncbi:GIY-YIG nuclease family protein [Gloeobacter violaceus]|uniref:Gll0731 protein n=1 Tax=Gloeobacter violaceus (strain ATCC 29082 / PCC 7421) TaxID=251221 RepID=Q7NMN4_GLOVI|nr:GIY-YIG nuclease family protein [Gloeobacter violaceus]BAC88672.1 gll0731 [Gloeobacter violaceus PCC 7421]